MEMKELFVTNRVTVRDLVPNRINPRKIKSEEKKKLWERLNRFGMIGIPVRDADGTLLSGHQRCELMMSYGFGEYVIDVRTATRKLTDQEIKEVMLKTAMRASLILKCSGTSLAVWMWLILV
jgi:hypothetical protein